MHSIHYLFSNFFTAKTLKNFNINYISNKTNAVLNNSANKQGKESNIF
jgi:hypothetical protein